MRIIEIIADSGHIDTLAGIAEQHGVDDCWSSPPGEDGRCMTRMLVDDAARQKVVDTLQNVLGASAGTHIIIQPVEAVLPRSSEESEREKTGAGSGSQTREELYDRIKRGARLDLNYLLLVVLSTVVASIGLVEDNVAVIVGAMVIAPLLGPNIALAFSVALGDRRLMWQALQTNLAGIGLALLMSIATGALWQDRVQSSEILVRTDVGLAGVALALASGAAAVLSLVTGLSSTLVGVMVAVALLPPTATLGMMLGSGQYYLASGAGLLLAVNVVCINLAAKLMFIFRGVQPRTWLEKSKARQSLLITTLFWIVALALLMTAISVRHSLQG
ncbi:MAG: TIGR00341 family protein [Pseudomonadota bacterium]